MAARVYCAVLLCLSGCLSTEAAPGQNLTANPGVAINEKCCSNGCGLECLPPVIVNPGVCPSTKYEEIRCITEGLELCASDSECPKNQKCCSTACGGRQCTAPDTVKPGVCPRTEYGTIMCLVKDKDLCASDSECPKKEKCCGTSCGGTRCTAPVTVKPGVCPRTKYGTIMCLIKDKDLCADDSECPKKEKCCGTSCGGTRCMAPVTVNPGVCPSRKYKPAMCALIRYAPCGDDSDCANNQKCCNNGCGLQCMTPGF